MLECPDCGQFQCLPDMSRGGTAVCLRCDHALWRQHGREPLGYAMALTVAGVVIFLVALNTPMVTVDIVGIQRVSTLFTGAEQLGSGELWPLGVIVAMTIALMPAVKLAATLAVLIGLRQRERPRWLSPLFGWMQRIGRWAMIEVFLLGVFVAYSRLTAIGSVEAGPALYALGAFMLVMAAADAMMDGETVWRAMAPAGSFAMPEEAGPKLPGPRLIGCDRCHLASHADAGQPCPRCGASLRHRPEGSLQATWALVIAATILYLPANLYPVMTVIRFGQGAPNTILSGAEELLDVGLWPLALLVFFASITVPVLKLLSLVAMLIATQKGSARRLTDRTRLYRIVEAVGRWSMIDVFMISILVALVHVGAIASIEPGSGAVAFAAVVVLTMFAASSFDPRLMWDATAKVPNPDQRANPSEAA